MSDDVQYVSQLLRDLDREKYLVCLYFPEEARRSVTVLWAFDAEIRRIQDLVSEPLPGEIRLQWWRDLLQSGANVDAGPLAREMMFTVERHQLPAEVLHSYLNARIFDLYEDPMPDLGSLEGYLGETVSVIFQMVAFCMGAGRSRTMADACGHAGMAIGIIRLLRDLAKNNASGKLFIPLDVLGHAGLDRNLWLHGEVDHRHTNVLNTMIELAEKHLEQANHAIEALPQEFRPVFYQLALVPAYLRQARKRNLKILREPLTISPVKSHLLLLKAAMSG
ncbi:MAG: phytoene/squalene synthase family protein [Pseudomonadota bacterium]